jgi:menaquinol-cytochrome c reductase iron-sulfur subunit
MNPEPNRRSFLGFAVFGLGAIFTAILGVPVVGYLLDPLRRKGTQSNFKRVDGIRLDALAPNIPQQGVIQDTRRDGWVLYPNNDVVGRIWVVMVGAHPTLENAEQINQFNRDANRKKAYLLVFTTICPHLGCSVNFDAGTFICPCHAATFTVAGVRTGTTNPAARNMDTLEWEIDPDDPKLLRVQYQNFQASKPEKLPA